MKRVPFILISQEDIQCALSLINGAKMNLSKIENSYFNSEVRYRLEQLETLLTQDGDSEEE